MTTLEGWATKISDVADHTYVYCPSNGKYFNCWGGHSGPDERRICSGNGIYAVADCYRCPAFGHRDTACIGAYAVNGVCHQSANCFLYSAGTTLTLAVRGYWATVLAYGPYGTNFLLWLLVTYNPCYQKHKNAHCGEKAAAPVPNEGNELFEKIHEGYKEIKASLHSIHFHDIIVKDAATLALHVAPDLDVSAFEDRHRQHLKEKDEIINTSTKAMGLVSGINRLSREFQKELSDHFTDKVGDLELYKKLMGLEPGETVQIIDPNIAKKASDHIEKYLEKIRKE